MANEKRRNPLALGALLVLVMLVLAVGFKLVTSDDTKTPESGPESGSEAADRQRYQNAIDKGLSWVDSSRDEVSPAQLLIFDYLQRKFKLDPKFSGVNNTTLTEQQNNAQLRPYLRMVFPDILTESLPLEGAPPVDRMMLAAINCDHIPLFSGFKEVLQQEVEFGEYDLTHAAFALQLMKENGCETGLTESYVDLIATQMAALVTAPNSSADLRYEATAFLMYTGRRDLVKKEWIDRIVTEQRADGHWQLDNPTGPIHSTTNPGSDHTSLLALWSLLEFAHPDATDEPIIRRPSKSTS